MTSASHAEGRQFDPGQVYAANKKPEMLAMRLRCPRGLEGLVSRGLGVSSRGLRGLVSEVSSRGLVGSCLIGSGGSRGIVCVFFVIGVVFGCLFVRLA